MKARTDRYVALFLEPGVSLDEPPLPGFMHVSTCMETGEYDRVDFECPCGCGHRVYLMIDPGHTSRPSWDLDVDGERPTISPSVEEADGCKSHYLIRDGRVQWF
jgi:hypothetical protein